MSSPTFFDSAGWRQKQGSQQQQPIMSPGSADAPLQRRPYHPSSDASRCSVSRRRRRNAADNEPTELRRDRLATTLCGATDSAEIILPDGSVAKLPLCPSLISVGGSSSCSRRRSTSFGNLSKLLSSSPTPPSDTCNPHGSPPFRRSGTLQERNALPASRTTASMKDLGELHDDADDDGAYPTSSAQSRVTLEQKVLLRLSEMMSDSLLQAKLSALGVFADEVDEGDIEWVIAGELASKAADELLPVCKISRETSSRSLMEAKRKTLISSAELMDHAKSLRHCSSSRLTLVKAAKLFEELSLG